MRLRFSVLHPRTDERVRRFHILQDMPFHLFIARQDLTHLDHIHPTQLPDGSFEIETVLPTAGHYKIFSDFFPASGRPQKKEWPPTRPYSSEKYSLKNGGDKATVNSRRR